MLSTLCPSQPNDPFLLKVAPTQSEFWPTVIKQELSNCLLVNRPASFNNSNITFVCANNAKVVWNCLPYLAAMSQLLRFGGRQEENCTLHLPDYEARIVKTLLLLISQGCCSITAQEEVRCIEQLAKDLGVSKQCSYFTECLIMIDRFP